MTKMSPVTLDLYNQMLESINDRNNIKYMPYRIALKLTVLQKCTYCKYFYFCVLIIPH